MTLMSSLSGWCLRLACAVLVSSSANAAGPDKNGPEALASSIVSSPVSAWGTWNLPADSNSRTFSSFCRHLSARNLKDVYMPWLSERKRRKWVQTHCMQLPLWASWRGGLAPVFHHACNVTEEPTAADAVIGQALRLAFEYFLGRPEWSERGTCNPTIPENLEEADVSSAALIVGGGGLFSSSNSPSSRANARSSLNWLFNNSQMLAIEAAPLTLFGISCGAFGGNFKSSPCVIDTRIAQRVLAHPTSVIGVRESDAAENLMVSIGGKRRGRIRYQPCPTTLLGLLRPSLASTVLRSSEKRVLSLDISMHPRLTPRLGGPIKDGEIFYQLVEWCTRAYRAGWAIHLITSESWQWAKSPFLDYLAHLPHQPFTFELLRFASTASEGQDLLEYYRTQVTIAASTRAHGVMIPFGLHVATIALVADGELDSLLRAGFNETIRAVHLHALWRGSGNGNNSLTVADKLWQLLCDIDQRRHEVLRQIETLQGSLLSSTADTMADLGKRIFRKLGNLRTRLRLQELRPASTRLEAFLNLHLGKTIYVIGSGATAGYVNPNYFAGELAIGVNQACNRFTNLTYLLRKEPISKNFRQVLERSSPLTRHFVSRGSFGNLNCVNGEYVLKHFREATNVIVYEHSVQSLDYGDHILRELPPVPGASRVPRLVVSASTITTAIHLAAFMGAGRIILVGHDLLSLDGQDNFPGYHSAETLENFGVRNISVLKNSYHSWLKQAPVSADSISLRSLLMKRYPHLHINSLSPFIGLGLEGHHVGRLPPAKARGKAANQRGRSQRPRPAL